MPINTQSYGNTQAHSDNDQRYDGSVTNRQDAHVGSAEVKKYIGGVKFPADKYALVEYAEQQQAPTHLTDLLRQLPTSEFGSPNATHQTEYNNIDELIQELEKIE